ncbi:ATP/GTP-binding protein [Actinomadura graeca]|uniref:ATP/GTP-binding protein n=1 Tax=Actinomadura graeca TaxID=2750812 RepID=A0ABX8R460_9ACTN|nr:ATP/GTP-binding protein [Actinomadura graeca]QXJ25847.1 ATP/GTP-binding protein [Actinomadura graeca]
MQPCEVRPAPAPARLKIIVAGGLGAGKTTLIGAVSEIAPLATEEHLTAAGGGVDCLSGVAGKTTTTVSLDFGRRSFTDPAPMALFLFGTPGQDRFRFVWDELAFGAVGAVVLVDTRRLPAGFAAVDYFEGRGVPFVVAVNRFPGTHPYTPAEVGQALQLGAGVPVVGCDARDPGSVLTVLITLVEHALTRPHATPAPAPASPVHAAPSPPDTGARP